MLRVILLFFLIFISFTSLFSQNLNDTINSNTYSIDTVITYNADSTIIDTTIILKKSNVVVEHDTVIIVIDTSYVLDLEKFTYSFGIESNYSYIDNNNYLNRSTRLYNNQNISFYNRNGIDVNFYQRSTYKNVFFGVDLGIRLDCEFASINYVDTSYFISSRFIVDTLQFIKIESPNESVIYAIQASSYVIDSTLRISNTNKFRLNTGIVLSIPVYIGFNVKKGSTTFSPILGMRFMYSFWHGHFYSPIKQTILEYSPSNYNSISVECFWGVKFSYPLKKNLFLFGGLFGKYSFNDFYKYEVVGLKKISFFELKLGVVYNLRY
ncbi:MAG: hypothetical protein IPO21_15670 [Bacteroidales bacterium]|nr:hypothetical protein [Bacteroidales bacterium]